MDGHLSFLLLQSSTLQSSTIAQDGHAGHHQTAMGTITGWSYPLESLEAVGSFTRLLLALGSAARVMVLAGATLSRRQQPFHREALGEALDSGTPPETVDRYHRHRRFPAT